MLCKKNGYCTKMNKLRKIMAMSFFALLFITPNIASAVCTFESNTTNCACNNVASAYANGVFFILGDQGSHFAYRTSFTSGGWTIPSNNFSGQSNVVSRDVAYGNGYYVGVGTNTNYIAYTSSPSGTWQLGTKSTAGQTLRVKFFNNLFVTLVYNNNKALYSSTGATWTSATLPTTSPWTLMTTNGTYLIAASESGAITWTNNGTNWVDGGTLPGSTTTYGNWVGFEYVGGTYYAISQYGYLTRSNSGRSNWSTPTRIITSANLPSNVSDANIRIKSLRIDPTIGYMVAHYEDSTMASSRNGVFTSFAGGTLWCLTERNQSWFRGVSIGGGYIFSGGTSSYAHWADINNCTSCACTSDCTYNSTQTGFCNAVVNGAFNGTQTCNVLKDGVAGCYTWGTPVNCVLTCTSGFNPTHLGTCGQICTAGFTTLRTSSGINSMLYDEKITTPSLSIRSPTNYNHVCYAPLVAGTASNSLNFNVSGTTYHTIP